MVDRIQKPSNFKQQLRVHLLRCASVSVGDEFNCALEMSGCANPEWQHHIPESPKTIVLSQDHMQDIIST